MCIYLLPGYSAGLLFSERPNAVSLDLFSGEKVEFEGGVTIAFDFALYDAHKFGQVMVFDNDHNAFSLTYIPRDSTHFSLVINSLLDRSKPLYIALDPGVVSNRSWHHIAIKFSFTDNLITISIDGESYILREANIPDVVKANFIFGSNKRSLVDVPSIAIKNIEISNNKGKQLYYFLLNESSGNYAHELNGKVRGTVKNPIWLINKQHYWALQVEPQADPAAGIVYDTHKHKLFILDKTTAKEWDPISGQLSQYTISPYSVMNGYSGELIVDSIRNSFYYYNLMDMAGVAIPFFVELTETGAITKMRQIESVNPLHHHAYVFFNKSRDLWIFGGYGNYEYSNDFYSFNFDKYEWQKETLTGDIIQPRMHTVAGIINDDEFLIFGGVGNEIGKQELGKDFFFDLYKVNIRNRTVKKLWEISKPEVLYAPTRGIIYDSVVNVIYVLCFDRADHCRLMCFDVATGKSTVVSDPIPYVGQSILSSFYLFYDDLHRQFYAVCRQTKDHSAQSAIQIYSLGAPPLSVEELEGSYTENTTPSNSLWIMLAAISAIIAMAILLLYFKRKRNKKYDGLDVVEHVKPDEEKDLAVESRANAVYVFGDLTIIDRNGIDITNRFGSKIRQVFVLILLYTDRGKGITSEKLSTIFWPDKGSKDAKNIRGVTINHLRNLISDIDGLSLVFENNYWQLIHEPPFYCDLFQAHYVADLSKKSDTIDYALVAELATILRRGTLLPGFIKYEWFDSIKLDNEDYLHKVIEKVIPNFYTAGHYKEVIRLADILFAIDKYNETALHYKVDSLKMLGKVNLAIAVRKRFEEGYKNS
ncbi:MAG: hypothetical protein LBG19_08550 [Prevotellaceae bacterium]|nr:hypothetical protein [Prevotellaceae bacterium]